MKLAYLAFSEQGYELAKTLAKALGGEAARSGVPDGSGKTYDLRGWTKAHFPVCDALVYVGAMGIAIRAIAPFANDKTSDPAVVVIDEKALHVIPVLSGHLGGANDLARRIAEVTGSDCVITTATDVNGVFAVDEWSKHQNCALLDPKKIVRISGGLLHGATFSVYSPWDIKGTVPDGLTRTDDPEAADILLDIRSHAKAGAAAGDIARPLRLVPRICTLGVGCRKDTPAETIEEQLQKFLKETGIFAEAICGAATIDIKKDEPGLIAFCEARQWTLQTYTSEELKQVQGEFSSSDFVSSVTGVDNVCERSAALAAGNADPGTIIEKKFAGNGVTLALAAREYRPDWTWKQDTK